MSKVKIIISLLITLFFVNQSHAQIKIAGHRSGYYFEYPESSLPLMQFIEKQFGLDTIMTEVDLRMSKSGTIYMMHDETVDRTTTGKGKVSDLTDGELNGLFLKKETGAITDQHIPTLENLLKFAKNKKINLMLDIKTPMPGGDLPGKMEQTEMDLVNKQITEQTIQRQKEILTRLLESEKSMREQDLDEERKGEYGVD